VRFCADVAWEKVGTVVEAMEHSIYHDGAETLQNAKTAGLPKIAGIEPKTFETRRKGVNGGIHSIE
jgi:hypothetical protein